MQEDLDIFDFQLTNEEVLQLSDISNSVGGPRWGGGTLRVSGIGTFPVPTWILWICFLSPPACQLRVVRFYILYHSCQLRLLLRFSFSFLRCELQSAVGTTGPELRAPDLSGHDRT